MPSSAAQQLTDAWPQLQVEQFVERFDQSYRQLAAYAALPLILTPELLHYLRTKFLPGRVPWVAEADLLLSDLCRQVGYEQYVMDPAVRDYLLVEGRKLFGEHWARDAAWLLLQYADHQFANSPFVTQDELQTQRWAAMLYIAEQREQAIREMVAAFNRAAPPDHQGAASPAINHAELARMSRITRILAPQLDKKRYKTLLEYAELVGQLLENPHTVNVEQLRQSGKLDRRPRIRLTTGTLDLPAPGLLVDQAIQQVAETIVTPAGTRRALLIGISQYRGQGSPPLPHCAQDAAAIARVLGDFGYNVRMLADQEASWIAIQEALAEICVVADEDDLLWVHFAGYGAQPVGFQDDILAFASDTHQSALAETMLSMDMFKSQMDRSEARSKLITMDTVDFGTLDDRLIQAYQRSSFKAERPKHPTPPGDFTRIAVSVDPHMLDSSSREHSPFTTWLLDGLRGQADPDGKGFITLADLMRYIQDQSQEGRRARGVDVPYRYWREGEGEGEGVILVDNYARTDLFSTSQEQPDDTSEAEEIDYQIELLAMNRRMLSALLQQAANRTSA